MDLSGRGQHFGFVRWVGLMNGSWIAVKSWLAAITFVQELLCLNKPAPCLIL